MSDITWFKVDDDFWSHPKVVALPPAAGWLWTRAGSYCGRHLTDGFVSHAAMGMLAGKDQDSSALVDAGLWFEVDGGHQFHDWHTYQPTRESVMAERAAAAERQRKSRTTSQQKSRRDSRVTSDVTSAAPYPSPNPVPNPYPNTNTDHVSPEGDASGNARQTDLNVGAVQSTISLYADIDATEDEAARYAGHILVNSTGVVKHQTKYVCRSIENSPAECSDWFTQHRRHLKAAS